MIQLNALEDRSVPDKHAWNSAMKFMEKALRERLEQTEQILNELKGPNFKDRWLYWKTPSDIHKQRQAAQTEISAMLRLEPVSFSVHFFFFRSFFCSNHYFFSLTRRRWRTKR